jgi:predicted signal transduction protein with EAL and GGDEF domain
MSLGIALHPCDSCDPEQLIDVTDSARYRAKHIGQKRTVLYRKVALSSTQNLAQPLRYISGRHSGGHKKQRTICFLKYSFCY